MRVNSRAILSRFGRIVRWGVVGVLLLMLTVYLVRAFDSRELPELAPWHTLVLEEEFRAEGIDESTTFADLLAAEQRVLDEVDRRIYAEFVDRPELLYSRYRPGSDSDPRTHETNWNRTFELVPDEVRGCALLVHGVTDSPYSLRRFGEVLRDEGYLVRGLRLPGHGTIPAALTDISWKDWKVALSLAARDLVERARERAVGETSVDFVVVGHSTGGALVVDYAAGALLHGVDPLPDQLVLVSPSIGITPLAVVSSWHQLASFMPYFHKFRWQSVLPEYDPYKYNSFAKNAGAQVYAFTNELQAQVQRLEREGKIDAFPSTLVFQSLIDSTVSTSAITSRLLDKLDQGEHELVLFDFNRMAALRSFLSAMDHSLLDRLEQDPERRYRLTIISNADALSSSVVVRSMAPGAMDCSIDGLGLEWPRGVYSLSHVAMPFGPDDPLYGSTASEGWTMSIGAMAPRGESGLLRLPLGHLMRLRYNPFFAYIEERLRRLRP